MLYLCGWLWGEGPSDPIAASFANGKTDCNSYKKSTVMSLTGWGHKLYTASLIFTFFGDRIAASFANGLAYSGVAGIASCEYLYSSQLRLGKAVSTLVGRCSEHHPRKCH